MLKSFELTLQDLVLLYESVMHGLGLCDLSIELLALEFELNSSCVSVSLIVVQLSFKHLDLSHKLFDLLIHLLILIC